MNKELLGKLNKFLANLGVEYIKLHNLHWNVVGINFKSIHEYLEVLYNNISLSLDSVAEIIKMNGEVPLASLKEFLDVATIKEICSCELKGYDALKIVLEDLCELKNLTEDIRRTASCCDEYAIIAFMEDTLQELNKNIWFIKSTLK